MKFTCIECESPFDSSTGDVDERTCSECLEEEYSVTVKASYGVMAKNQESANNYIIEQFQNGNHNYTSDVEVEWVID